MTQFKKALIGLAVLAVLGFGTNALAATVNGPQQLGFGYGLFDINGNPIVVVQGDCSTTGGGC